jgi:amidohydrolase
VDRILACHVHPGLPVKTAGLHPSQSHASTDPFHLIIKGKGGHGGHPDQAIDPIVAGAYFVSMLQTIVARNVDPLETAVVHVGKFAAGTAGNVIPGHAELAGGVRALTPCVRDLLLKRVQDIVKGMELNFGVRCELTFHKGYPPCVNDPDVYKFMHDIGAHVLGPENIKTLKPSTGAEDFAFFAKARPSAMMMLGCRNEEKGIVHPLHSAYFDLDERVLDVGVKIFTEAVCRYLS